jgi:phosphatidyl-myo-inositol dimannoside synthase
MRVLVLIHDAFGGRGGIAKFNRDLLTALASAPGVTEVVALPRYIVEPVGTVPENLQYDEAASHGKLAYLSRLIRHMLSGDGFDLVVCGHINLLPFAAPWALRAARPIALILHGTEAWTPNSPRIVDRFRNRIDRFMPVSALTRDRFVAWSGYDPDKAVVLPNCVELSRYAPGPKPPALLDRYGLSGRRVLMTLGRLETTQRSKGHR